MLTTYGLLSIVTNKRNDYSQDIKTIGTTFHMEQVAYYYIS